IIHMIFELFVSSALIRAYTSEIPGACAAIGMAPSNSSPARHAHAFTTVPPRKHNSRNSPECSFLFPRRQYTLARCFAQFVLAAYFSRHSLTFSSARESPYHQAQGGTSMTLIS